MGLLHARPFNRHTFACLSAHYFGFHFEDLSYWVSRREADQYVRLPRHHFLLTSVILMLPVTLLCVMNYFYFTYLGTQLFPRSLMLRQLISTGPMTYRIRASLSLTAVMIPGSMQLLIRRSPPLAE
jgi:hypothetical protein